MLKNLVIVLGLVAGLSACMGPYGYDGYDNGYNGLATTDMATTDLPTTDMATTRPPTMDPATASTARCNDGDPSLRL
jgi:hypothetical protein